MTSPGFNVFLSQPLAAMNFGLEPPTFHFSMVPLAWTSSAIITCGLAQVNAVTVPVYRDLPGSIDRPVVVREQRTRGHQGPDHTQRKRPQRSHRSS